jgi:hypothetical protein
MSNKFSYAISELYKNGFQEGLSLDPVPMFNGSYEKTKKIFLKSNAVVTIDNYEDRLNSLRFYGVYKIYKPFGSFISFLNLMQEMRCGGSLPSFSSSDTEFTTFGLSFNNVEGFFGIYNYVMNLEIKGYGELTNDWSKEKPYLHIYECDNSEISDNRRQSQILLNQAADNIGHNPFIF